MQVYKFGITEIVVHINEKLNKENQHNLKENLCNLNGISTVLINDQKPHLMRVTFDPKTINSHQVLEGVKNHGVNAQLAGWL